MYSVYANRVPALIATFLILTSLFFTHTSRAEEPAKKATPPDKTEKKEQTKADPLSVACKKIDDTRKKTCGDLKKLGDDLKKELEDNKKLTPGSPAFNKAVDAYARKKDAFDRGVEKAKKGVPADRRPHTTDLGCSKKAILSGNDADCAKTSDAKDAKSGIRGRNATDIKDVQGKTIGAEFCEVKNGLYTGDVRKESTSTPYSYVAVIKGKSGFTTQNKQFCLDQERIVTNAGKNCAACAKGASLWNPALGDLAPGVATCGTSKVSGIKEAVPIVCRENYEKAIADAAKKKLEQDAFDSKDFNPYKRPEFVPEQPKAEEKKEEKKADPVADAKKATPVGTERTRILVGAQDPIYFQNCSPGEEFGTNCIAEIRRQFSRDATISQMSDPELRQVLEAGGRITNAGGIAAPSRSPFTYGATYDRGDAFLVSYTPNDASYRFARVVDIATGVERYVHLESPATFITTQNLARCGRLTCP